MQLNVLKKLPLGRLAIVITLLLAVSSISTRSVLFSSGWPPKEYSARHFVNLTRQAIQWDISYGGDGKCVTSECFLSPQAWEYFEDHAVLPHRNYAATWKTRSGHLIYRTSFDLPDTLKKTTDAVSFHFLRLYAEEWHFFVNDTLVESGKGSTGGNLRIPVELRQQPGPLRLTLAMTTTRTAEPGFDTRAELLVGLDAGMRGLSSQYVFSGLKTNLWFVIPRFAITVVFAVACLFFPFYGESLALVLFSFFSSIRILLLSGGSGLPPLGNLDPWLIVNMADFFAGLALLGFFSLYFRQRHRSIPVILVACGAIFTTAIIALNRLLTPQEALWVGHHVVHLFQALVYSYGTFVSTKTAYDLFRSRRSRIRLGISSMFAIILLVLVPTALGRYFGVPQFSWEKMWWEMAIILLGAASVTVEWSFMGLERLRLGSRLHMVVDKKVMNELFFKASIPEPRRQTVTIMMTDLRSFTAMSEKYPPAQVVAALNDYLKIVSEAVQKQGGMVDKFMGDAVLALWGIPVEEGQESLRAVRAALEIRRRLNELNHIRRSKGKFPIFSGIAIHRGEVIVGPVGSERRLDYTAIGTAVNVVARVQGLSKTNRRDILITESVFCEVENDCAVFSLGKQALRGSGLALTIYHLVGARMQSNSPLVTYDPIFRLMEADLRAGKMEHVPPNTESEPYSGSAAS